MALLSGQVAIVTGAGRGLGRAVSETLAALGASVVLASRNAPELDEVVKGIKRSGGHALAQTADVADERQIQDLALEVEGTGVTACAFNPGAMDTDMQERIRRTASSDFPRADEYREAAREGRLIDPKAPARAIAYLVLPSTQRNGQVLQYDDDQLRSAVESALPG